jgi:hypothetical protein
VCAFFLSQNGCQDSYVEPRWQEHGAGRVSTVCPSALCLDCHAPTHDNVTQLLATGWFTDKKFGGGTGDVGEDSSGSASSTVHDNGSGGGGGGGGIGRASNSGNRGPDKLAPGVQIGADGEPVLVEETSMPSVFSFSVAFAVAGAASMLPPAHRAGIFALLAGGYWVLRARHTSN